MEQMHIAHSEALYDRAKELMPGGVNSPVRAFQSVGGTPRFIQRAKDQYLYDEDGNVYIDYIGSVLLHFESVFNRLFGAVPLSAVKKRVGCNV